MFRAGQQVRVPNIGADRIDAAAVDDRKWLATLVSLGVGSDQAKATRIVVSKSKGTLKAFDAQDKLVALFTLTSGSSHDPLPLGTWGINGVSKNPPFVYDPTLFWDVPDHEEKQQLPPGPNGPVGVVWIDLTKEHYGIHGTPEPQTIGRAESHGCVRLTNWDAARLAQMVSGSTKVLFEA
jgi:lipoprotein-anchoring transpeptidase ErfK/SrfK